jgi:hypothetical protein
MAPEYGATIGFFPVDSETLSYLRFTGRPASHVEAVEAYCRAQGIFHTPDTPEPVFSDLLSLDLGTVEPSLAGPKRPQDRVPLKDAKQVFQKSLVDMVNTAAPQNGMPRPPPDRPRRRRRPASLASVGERGGEPGHTELPLAARRGGDCRHHLLHQHQQPRGAPRRGAPGEAGGGRAGWGPSRG